MIILYVYCSVALYGKKAKGRNDEGSDWLREQRNGGLYLV